MAEERLIDCGTCTMCCKFKGRYTKLLPEDVGKYEQYEKNGEYYLAKDEDDVCVYLKWTGERHLCSIYETRPQICRSWVCTDDIDEPLVHRVIWRQAIKRVKDPEKHIKIREELGTFGEGTPYE